MVVGISDTSNANNCHLVLTWNVYSKSSLSLTIQSVLQSRRNGSLLSQNHYTQERALAYTYVYSSPKSAVFRPESSASFDGETLAVPLGSIMIFLPK